METMRIESSANNSTIGPAEPRFGDSEYRTVDLGRILNHFWRRRLMLLTGTFAGGLIGAVASIVIHPEFDATARLMPPERKEASFISFSSRNDGDLYLSLMNSRTVADDVIERQHLADYFHSANPSALRRRLAGMTKISVDKDQFITVVVRASEPETAVRIANEYPDALSRLNRVIAQSQAGHRWEYYEGPLEQERNNLSKAEDALKQAEQKTGIVAPESQVQLGLSAIASLKQQITVREEQRAALETNSTEQNPQVVQLNSQIATLSAQLKRLQAQNGGSSASSDSAKMPELTLEIERLTRDVKFHEALFQIISRQYENARVDDSYSPPVELIDKAVMPDEKAWPPRKLFVLGGLLIGGILAMALIYLKTLQPIRRIRAILRDDTSAQADVSRV